VSHHREWCLLAIIGIVRSATRESSPTWSSARERAAAASRGGKQQPRWRRRLNEPVAAGSIGPRPDEDPTKGTDVNISHIFWQSFWILLVWVPLVLLWPSRLFDIFFRNTEPASEAGWWSWCW